MHPGFRTLGLWLPERNERIDVSLWYPSVRSPSEFRIYEWTLDVARNGKPVPGRFPLVLLSHGTGGSRFAHHDIAASLASSGFVVAALTHPGDNIDDTSTLFGLQQLTQRPRQISLLLDHLLRDPATLELIDPSRIAVVGFGVGGTTAIMLAGGIPDGTEWKNYCEKAMPADPYCSAWSRPRLDALSEALQKSPPVTSQRDERIRVAVAVAPAYGMMFSRKGLAPIQVPVFLLKAEQDEVNRAPFHADAFRAGMPTPPEFAILGGADHFSLMAPCPPALMAALPEVCSAVDEESRERIHTVLSGHLVRFLVAQLGEAGPLPPPVEAELAPQPVAPPAEVAPQSAPQANATKGKAARNRPAVKSNATRR